MKLSRGIVGCLIVVFAVCALPGLLKAEEFKIAILRNDQFSASQYEPLVAHLAKTGIAVHLVEVPTYQAAARMISAGEVDAMFNGPGIAGSMIVIHELQQQRTFANSKKDDARVQRVMPSQNRLN